MSKRRTYFRLGACLQKKGGGAGKFELGYVRLTFRIGGIVFARKLLYSNRTPQKFKFDFFAYFCCIAVKKNLGNVWKKFKLTDMVTVGLFSVAAFVRIQQSNWGRAGRTAESLE